MTETLRRDRFDRDISTEEVRELLSGEVTKALAPVAKRLSELLGFKVRFEREWLGGVECSPG